MHDQACKNQLCERKLYQVLFLLISLVLNAVSHLYKLWSKALNVCSGGKDLQQETD